MARKKLRRAAAFTTIWRTVRGADTPGAPGLGQRVRALPRMFGWALTGRYPLLGLGRIAMRLFGVIYIVSPIDLVPEMVLPVIGFGDDAVVLAWLVGTVLAEADRVIEWQTAVPGAGEDPLLGGHDDEWARAYEPAGARTVPGQVLR